MCGVNSEIGHPQIAGAHHMGLSVRDLDRSIRFYCDVLGAVTVHRFLVGWRLSVWEPWVST